MLKHGDLWLAIDRLAENQGLSVSGLAKRAGLDATAFNKSKRVSAGGKKRWPTTESLAKVLEATATSLGEFVALIGDFDRRLLVPRFPLTTSDPADQTCGQAPRRNGSRGREIFFPLVDDPEAFALAVVDDSLAPLYRAGDVLLISPNAELRRGDRVVLKTTLGGPAAWLFQHPVVAGYELASPASPQDITVIRSDQVEWVGRVLWASQ